MTEEFIQTIYIIEFCLAAVSTLGIAGLLIFSRPLKSSPHPEDKMFRKLCWILLFYAVTYVPQYIQRIFRPIPYYRLSAHLIIYFSDFVMLYFLAQWLVFVDLAVNHSPEGAKRRTRYFWIPFVVMTVLVAAGYVFLIRVHEGTLPDGTLPAAELTQYRTWSWVYYYVGLFIFIAYLLSAYRLVKFHNSEYKRPLFLRLSVFIIPWVFAYVIQNIPELYLVIDVPCAVISLLLTYHSMRNRYKYMDYETGLYNEDFLVFFEKYARIIGISGGCAILFTSSAEPKEFARVLQQYKPEKSLVLLMNNGSFLVLSTMDKKTAVTYFIELIKDAAKEEFPNIEIDAQYCIHEKKASSADPKKRPFAHIELLNRINGNTGLNPGQ